MIRNKKKNKVTIITPVYNNKEDILTALESVINQSYAYWEYIIVDDCSTDGTCQLLVDKLKTLNMSNIKLLKNSKNMGTYISINKAIKNSNGNYICLLGSDDNFHKHKLKKQIDVLNKNPDILVSEAWYKRGDLIVKYNVAAFMFRRSIISDIGYFDSVRFGADSEFKHRISKYYGNGVFSKIPEVLYFAKIRPNSLTRSKETGRKDIRIGYRDKFYEWHRQAKRENTLFINYPLLVRPFEVHKIMLPK